MIFKNEKIKSRYLDISDKIEGLSLTSFNQHLLKIISIKSTFWTSDFPRNKSHWLINYTKELVNVIKIRTNEKKRVQKKYYRIYEKENIIINTFMFS
jgi:hypothetical protein